MMSEEEFNKNFYTYFSIDNRTYKSDKMGVNGCLMYNDTYILPVVIVDGEFRHFVNFNMLKPEVLIKFDDYPITKEDIDELMNILEKDGLWNRIIEDMRFYIKSELITEKDLNIDLSKIPTTPPDYRLLIKENIEK